MVPSRVECSTIGRCFTRYPLPEDLSGLRGGVRVYV